MAEQVRVGFRAASFSEDFPSTNDTVFETNSIETKPMGCATTAPVRSEQAVLDSSTQWA
jgi:hypothetical protein